MNVYILVLILLIASIMIGRMLIKQRNEIISLRNYKDRHDTINNIVRSINTGMSSENIIQIALEEISKKFPFYRVSYSTISEHGRLKVWSCITPESMPSIHGLESDLTVAHDYLRELKELSILAVEDVSKDQRFLPLKAAMIAGNTRAVLDIPITHNDSFVGLFCMDANEVHVWSEDEIKMLTETAKYLELSIRQAEYIKLQKEMDAQLTDYAKRLEAKVAERTKKLQEAMQKAEKLAMTDELSQLPSRRAFFEASEKLFLRAKRYNQSFSVLIFDIDRFKSINDHYGHAVGDTALKTMGEVMKSTLRSSDIVGRIGGEEFAVTLPEADLDEAMQYAERLRAFVDKNIVHTAMGEIHFTISIGVATFCATDDSLKSIIARADAALYHAKESGRNRVISEIHLNT